MELLLLPRYRSESNQQFAYRVIKNNIMTMRLLPGEILDERQLSETLNMSRTPIREALINLKQEYIVDIYPQKKTHVSLVDLALVQDGQFVRSNIEPHIIELCGKGLGVNTIYKLKENLSAQKCALEAADSYYHFLDLDNSFHKTLYTAVGKDKIWDCISTISSQYNRIRYFDVMLGTDRLNPIYEQHVNLYNILVSQSVDGANIHELVSEHLGGYRSMLPTLLERYKEFFLK